MSSPSAGGSRKWESGYWGVEEVDGMSSKGMAPGGNGFWIGGYNPT